MKNLLILSILLVSGLSNAKANSALHPDLINSVRSACVEVLVDRQLRGGGAIVESGKNRAYVVTAAHLFPRPNAYTTIMTEGHGMFNANVVAYDIGHDLALLEIVTSRELPVLSICSYCPSPTQPVYNFGPALRRRTLIISGDMADSRINYTDFEPSDGYLAHVFIAAINPVFSSGGIWVNQEGEIIGVQSGRLKGDVGAPSSGLSMACPPSAVRRLVKSKKTANTPGIGGWVWELWTVDHKILQLVPENMNGLAVRWVREGGALQRAGVKEQEIIVACDRKKITRRNELFSAIRSRPVGSTFTLTVFSPTTQQIRKTKLKTLPLEARWNAHLQNLRMAKAKKL